MDITTLAAWGEFIGRHRGRRIVDLPGFPDSAELPAAASRSTTVCNLPASGGRSQ